MVATEDEAAVRQRIDQLIAAIRAMDLEAAKALYGPDIVSFDAGPPLQRVGREAKAANWMEAFALFQPPLGYEVRGVTITMGGGVAFAHGFARLSGTLKDGTRGGGFWVRGTFCLRKIDGEWLIAHDHVSVPLDLSSGRGVLNLEP